VTSTIDTAGNPVQQVTFNFTGDASLISYYSGLIGGEYAYREGRILEVSGLRSSFTSVAPSGSQQNSLSVMASTDFNGIYDKENVQAATWIDITNRYALNALGASSALHSGFVDISDLLVEGKPIYFAFRYICLPQAANGANTTWRIRDFMMESETILGITPLATQTTANWHVLDFDPMDPPSRGARIESNGAVRFNGNHITKEVRTESWGITKAFTVDEIDLGPDRPVAVKGTIDPQLSSSSFNYTKSGTYKAVFVATNATYQGQASVVREIEVIVP